MKNRQNLNKKQNGKSATRQSRYGDGALSRRDFMGAAATTAVFTFVPRFVMGGARNIPPSEKLNVACIGVGGMGGAMSDRSARKI